MSNKKDEKSDIESESDNESEHDKESSTKKEDDFAMPTYPSNETNNNNNQQSTHDDINNQINADSVEEQRDPILHQRDLELVQNKDKYHLTDNLLDKDSVLKSDSRNEAFINKNAKYERLQEDTEHESSFKKFINRVIESIVRFFTPKEQEGPLPRVRGYIISSPITPYIYSVDYSIPSK